MKKILNLLVLLTITNIALAQKTQLIEFQRYSFGTLKNYISNNSKETLNSLRTKMYSFDSDNTALVFETDLVDFDAFVRYQFENGKLKDIYFENRCHAQNGVMMVNGKSNECTTSTLKEFFKLKN